jgi:hypothetical protein
LRSTRRLATSDAAGHVRNSLVVAIHQLLQALLHRAPRMAHVRPGEVLRSSKDPLTVVEGGPRAFGGYQLLNEVVAPWSFHVLKACHESRELLDEGGVFARRLGKPHTEPVSLAVGKALLVGEQEP